MFNDKISTPPTATDLKPGAKIILLLIAGAVLFFGFRTAVSRGWIPARASRSPSSRRKPISRI